MQWCPVKCNSKVQGACKHIHTQAHTDTSTAVVVDTDIPKLIPRNSPWPWKEKEKEREKKTSLSHRDTQRSQVRDWSQEPEDEDRPKIPKGNCASDEHQKWKIEDKTFCGAVLPLIITVAPWDCNHYSSPYDLKLDRITNRAPWLYKALHSNSMNFYVNTNSTFVLHGLLSCYLLFAHCKLHIPYTDLWS